MLVFWSVVGVALVGLVVWAARVDARARRAGKIVVPVSRGFGRRTHFQVLDRSTYEAQRAERAAAEQDKRRRSAREAPPEAAYLSATEAMGSFVGFFRRRTD